MPKLTKNVAPNFIPNKQYSFGEHFLYAGKLYEVIRPFISDNIIFENIRESSLAELVSGARPLECDYSGKSVETDNVLSADGNTFFGVPQAGYYNETSKIFTSNSNVKKPLIIEKFYASTNKNESSLQGILSVPDDVTKITVESTLSNYRYSYYGPHGGKYCYIWDVTNDVQIARFDIYGKNVYGVVELDPRNQSCVIDRSVSKKVELRIVGNNCFGNVTSFIQLNNIMMET